MINSHIHHPAQKITLTDWVFTLLLTKGLKYVEYNIRYKKGQARSVQSGEILNIIAV